MKVRVRVSIKLNIFVSDTIIAEKTDFPPINSFRETAPLQQAKGMPVSEHNTQECRRTVVTALCNDSCRQWRDTVRKPLLCFSGMDGTHFKQR